jgi:hypothetical protein
MTTRSKDILPGWTFNADEFSPGVYRLTLTDKDGRKAEIVDDFTDLTVDICVGYAFDIERQTKRNWSKFLFDLVNLKLVGREIERNEHHDRDFGSWVIQTKNKRLLLDGKDGWLTYQEKESGNWIDKETIKDYKRVTFEQFKSFIGSVV